MSWIWFPFLSLLCLLFISSLPQVVDEHHISNDPRPFPKQLHWNFTFPCRKWNISILPFISFLNVFVTWLQLHITNSKCDQQMQNHDQTICRVIWTICKEGSELWISVDPRWWAWKETKTRAAPLQRPFVDSIMDEPRRYNHFFVGIYLHSLWLFLYQTFWLFGHVCLIAIGDDSSCFVCFCFDHNICTLLVHTGIWLIGD